MGDRGFGIGQQKGDGLFGRGSRSGPGRRQAGEVRCTSLCFQVVFLCIGFAVFALTSPLCYGGLSVVPSEDYSHAPPCFAVFFRKGRKTETEPQSSKKKTMKTNTEKNTKSGLLSRPEPLSNAYRKPIDFRRRKTNRLLDTAKLLSLLERDTPKFFELAEVVGNWVGIQFAGRQPAQVTRILAELGFHWNNARQAWQHPCGTIAYDRATYDPRQRYGSYFPAAVKLA
jgi:hypothetical protein